MRRVRGLVTPMPAEPRKLTERGLRVPYRSHSSSTQLNNLFGDMLLIGSSELPNATVSAREMPG
jgi:hypothetical protein